MPKINLLTRTAISASFTATSVEGEMAVADRAAMHGKVLSNVLLLVTAATTGSGSYSLSINLLDAEGTGTEMASYTVNTDERGFMDTSTIDTGDEAANTAMMTLPPVERLTVSLVEDSGTLVIDVLTIDAIIPDVFHGR